MQQHVKLNIRLDLLCSYWRPLKAVTNKVFYLLNRLPRSKGQGWNQLNLRSDQLHGQEVLLQLNNDGFQLPS